MSSGNSQNCYMKIVRYIWVNLKFSPYFDSKDISNAFLGTSRYQEELALQMVFTTCQDSTLVGARDTGTHILQRLPGKPEQKPEEYACSDLSSSMHTRAVRACEQNKKIPELSAQKPWTGICMCLFSLPLLQMRRFRFYNSRLWLPQVSAIDILAQTLHWPAAKHVRTTWIGEPETKTLVRETEEDVTKGLSTPAQLRQRRAMAAQDNSSTKVPAPKANQST